jgi:hypothetical protein
LTESPKKQHEIPINIERTVAELSNSVLGMSIADNYAESSSQVVKSDLVVRESASEDQSATLEASNRDRASSETVVGTNVSASVTATIVEATKGECSPTLKVSERNVESVPSPSEDHQPLNSISSTNTIINPSTGASSSGDSTMDRATVIRLELQQLSEQQLRLFEEYYELTGQALSQPSVTLSTSKTYISSVTVDNGVETGLVAAFTENVEMKTATQPHTTATATASAPVVMVNDLEPVDASIFHRVTPEDIL